MRIKVKNLEAAKASEARIKSAKGELSAAKQKLEVTERILGIAREQAKFEILQELSVAAGMSKATFVAIFGQPGKFEIIAPFKVGGDKLTAGEQILQVISLLFHVSAERADAKLCQCGAY